MSRLTFLSFPFPQTGIEGRAYFKDLRKSGLNLRSEWPRYHEYARTRGSIYGPLTGVKRGDESAGGERFGDDQSVSAHGHGHGHGHGDSREEKYSLMQGETSSGAHKEGGGNFEMNSNSNEELGRLSPEERYANRTPSPAPGSAGAYPLSPTMKALYPHDQPSSEHLRSTSVSRNKRTTQTQPFIPRDAAINRTDLIASAERIYSRYLMPGADKEVYLPPALRISQFPLSSSVLPAVNHPDYEYEATAQARVPDMFNEQKEFVHRAMEVDTFPRFLRAKGFANLTPVGAVVRLVVGLLSLWAGLATAFAFVLLDTKPKVRRLWVRLSRGFPYFFFFKGRKLTGLCVCVCVDYFTVHGGGGESGGAWVST